MRELYDRMARAPGTVDLDALYRRLGVIDGVELTFDEAAPSAGIRRAMNAPTDLRLAPIGPDE